MTQGSPAAGQDGESAFSAAAQRSQEQVVGAVVDGEAPAVAGLLVRAMNALAGAGVAGVGQGRQVECGGGPVQRAGDVEVLDAGQVVQVSGQRVGGPYRQAVRAHDGLDGRAEVAVFSGVPGVDDVACDAGGGLGEPVGG